MIKEKITTITDYISAFPEDVQQILEKIRSIVKNIAPQAVEDIKYGIPTFVYNGNLVHFAAYKKHIGFYPSPAGIEAFKEELKGYKISKGTVQFSLDKDIPYELIEKMVLFRVLQNTPE